MTAFPEADSATLGEKDDYGDEDEQREQGHAGQDAEGLISSNVCLRLGDDRSHKGAS